LGAIVNDPWGERARTLLAWALTSAAVLALPLAAGFGFARLFAPTLHSRYFPWLTGRALGIAAYLALTALVLLGIWMRHPWRLRRPVVHSETRLRVHATLASATIALVAGHVVSLASDKYAGVGWIGAIVPFKALYRPTAVALGVIAMLFMVLLFATARSAGRRGARHWLIYHRLASANFVLVWLHGVMAGTDTAVLRPLYVGTGGVVAFLAMTRYSVDRWSQRGDDIIEAPGAPVTVPHPGPSPRESVAS
jgi:hypothetical protein